MHPHSPGTKGTSRYAGRNPPVCRFPDTQLPTFECLLPNRSLKKKKKFNMKSSTPHMTLFLPLIFFYLDSGHSIK